MGGCEVESGGVLVLIGGGRRGWSEGWYVECVCDG